VIYVHLAAEALMAGTGIARVENVGPIPLNRLHTLLGDHCKISLKPVIDLPAGHTPKRTAAGRSDNPINTNGTHPLGDSEFAHAIWRAATSAPEPVLTS
jgi:hypothetical protein